MVLCGIKRTTLQSVSPGGGRSGQQVLQRGIVQFVDGDDVIQVAQVTLRVSHEVWDSGPGEHRQMTQPLHVFKRHLTR